MKRKIGISACLTGKRVRYDGAHKLAPYLIDALISYVELVPVCPEVECGLGVPREPMQLEGEPGQPRLVTLSTRVDQTERLLAWAKRRLAGLAEEDIRGFILKARSPSCGLEVMVYPPDGQPAGMGAGLFANAFMESFPDLPVADEESLSDPALLEEFIRRVSASA